MIIPLDVPLGFDDPPSVNLFHAILLIGGVPLLLFIAITTAVYLPSIIRGERLAPGHSPMQDQWLGGPAAGPAELTSGAQGAGTDAGAGTGGASGRW